MLVKNRGIYQIIMSMEVASIYLFEYRFIEDLEVIKVQSWFCFLVVDVKFSRVFDSAYPTVNQINEYFLYFFVFFIKEFPGIQVQSC